MMFSHKCSGNTLEFFNGCDFRIRRGDVTGAASGLHITIEPPPILEKLSQLTKGIYEAGTHASPEPGPTRRTPDHVEHERWVPKPQKIRQSHMRPDHRPAPPRRVKTKDPVPATFQSRPPPRDYPPHLGGTAVGPPRPQQPLPMGSMRPRPMETLRPRPIEHLRPRPMEPLRGPLHPPLPRPPVREPAHLTQESITHMFAVPPLGPTVPLPPIPRQRHPPMFAVPVLPHGVYELHQGPPHLPVPVHVPPPPQVLVYKRSKTRRLPGGFRLRPFVGYARASKSLKGKEET